MGLAVKRGVFLVVVAAFLLSMAVERGFAVYSAVVSVEPHQKTVKVGQVFTIDIRIENVTGLQAVDFSLKFNSVILNASKIDEGPFMKSFGDTFVVKQEIQRDYQLYRGRVWFAIVLTGNASATGSGTLATITFNATSAGEGELDLFSLIPYNLNQVTLLTCGTVRIPHTVSDGQVVVSSDPSDPPGDPPPDPPDDPPPRSDPSPDINGDGRIDIVDIAMAGRAFGAANGDSGFNLKADLDQNGVIDIVDISRVAVAFGRIV